MSFQMAGVPATPSSARELLRRCTRAAHESVEGMLGLMSPHLTLAEYRGKLSGFLAFHLAFEQRVAHHAAAMGRFGVVWEERRKVPRIEQDLAVLDGGGGPKLRAEPNEPLSLHLPTIAHAFGALYVVEGATLGGVVIGRHVQSVLRIGPDDGGAFLHGYGPATGSRWKELCSALELALVGAEARGAAVDAANATFRMFATCAEGPTR